MAEPPAHSRPSTGPPRPLWEQGPGTEQGALSAPGRGVLGVSGRPGEGTAAAKGWPPARGMERPRRGLDVNQLTRELGAGLGVPPLAAHAPVFSGQHHQSQDTGAWGRQTPPCSNVIPAFPGRWSLVPGRPLRGSQAPSAGWAALACCAGGRSPSPRSLWGCNCLAWALVPIPFCCPRRGERSVLSSTGPWGPGSGLLPTPAGPPPLVRVLGPTRLGGHFQMLLLPWAVLEGTRSPSLCPPPSIPGSLPIRLSVCLSKASLGPLLQGLGLWVLDLTHLSVERCGGPFTQFKGKCPLRPAFTWGFRKAECTVTTAGSLGCPTVGHKHRRGARAARAAQMLLNRKGRCWAQGSGAPVVWARLSPALPGPSVPLSPTLWQPHSCAGARLSPAWCRKALSTWWAAPRSQS